MSARPFAALFALCVLFAALPSAHAEPVVVGSKKFTESVILGEILAGAARRAGAEAEHKRELGGTAILYQALKSGSIDAYVEYTGTIREEILGGRPPTFAAAKDALGAEGIWVSGPLGFNNTYALGMRRAEAARLGVATISDLAKKPEIRFGLSNEFLDRKDGYPGLAARYGLAPKEVRGIDHDLAYRGLAEGQIDVVDLYSTDAEIAFYDLAVLRDDQGYFPAYQAVIVARTAFVEGHPEVLSTWSKLEGSIDEAAMVRMNARAKIEHVAEAQVAAEQVAALLGGDAVADVESRSEQLLRNTSEHLRLVSVSLFLALLLALPLGVLAARSRVVGRLVLGATGVVQTIPSLALLVVLIPLLGLGDGPAIAALTLYSLLPIVRATHAGLTGIALPLRESALALGLSPWVRLRRIELPLAAKTIFSGVQTAAVIDVGLATLGALVGSGGYGQPILTGIRLDRVDLILLGAIPAALLALVVQGLFDVLERWLLPRGLR